MKRGSLIAGRELVYRVLDANCSFICETKESIYLDVWVTESDNTY